MDDPTVLPRGLVAQLERLAPGAKLVAARVLGTGEVNDSGETTKAVGYGRPIRVLLDRPSVEGGPVERLDWVFHTAQPDDFGHDRRSDRAAEMLLAWDTFDRIPRHVRAIDVGLVRDDGGLVSLVGTGEAYFVSRWAEGTPYASDLRRIAQTGVATAEDLRRTGELARLLAAIHGAPGTHPGAYRRSIRDLVGSGEGIAGIADGFDPGTPGASRSRIEAIEQRCLGWRHRLLHGEARLRRTHGDFHPFNILFDDAGAPVLLDTSRGSEGDPADDVAALAINYLFFGVEHRATWPDGLGRLWTRFFDAYAELRSDPAMFEVIAPFFAWRGLVVASPRWYPNMTADDRDRILSFVERVLDAPRFDPAMGLEAMR